MSAQVVPEQLVGTWRLAREIDDRHTGQRLHLDGTTRLELVGDEVAWVESGLLSRPGASPTPVSRRLRVVRRDEAWWVLFEDGRDFHPWRPGRWVDHRCGADDYRGLIEVGASGWRVTWEVTGPAKAYTMTSTMTGVLDAESIPNWVLVRARGGAAPG